LTDTGQQAGARQQEDLLIKLDIINEVVNRTGITKTKAEMAVETVFETMKKALEQGDRIELRGFGVFNVKPGKELQTLQ
jgi:DNA-binding protein HU-beta